MDIIYGFICLMLGIFLLIILAILFIGLHNDYKNSKSTCKQCGKKTNKIKNGICIDCYLKKLNISIEQQEIETLKSVKKGFTITDNLSSKHHTIKTLLFKNIVWIALVGVSLGLIIGVISVMDLYNIYELCRFPIFLIVAYLMVISSLLSCYSYFINPKNPTCEDGFLLDLICNRSKIKTIILCLLCIFILLFSSKNFTILLGCDDIRIMPNGTYCYYVLATNEKEKTYTLPANIEKIGRNDYYVYNVYFDNGGYLYFANDDYFSFGERITHTDQDNRDWNIELTPYKTTHPEVEETEPIDIGWIITVFISVLSILISGIFYLISIDTYKKRNNKLIYERQMAEQNQVNDNMPMSFEDAKAVCNWDNYITHLQVARDKISDYLKEHTIEEIENAYSNNQITIEQYNEFKSYIEDIKLLNVVLKNRLDTIIDNQNMLLNKYYLSSKNNTDQQ